MFSELVKYALLDKGASPKLEFQTVLLPRARWVGSKTCHHQSRIILQYWKKTDSCSELCRFVTTGKIVFRKWRGNPHHSQLFCVSIHLDLVFCNFFSLILMNFSESLKSDFWNLQSWLFRRNLAFFECAWQSCWVLFRLLKIVAQYKEKWANIKTKAMSIHLHMKFQEKSSCCLFQNTEYQSGWHA